MHVLSTPPAFVLSQDQTLQTELCENILCSHYSLKELTVSFICLSFHSSVVKVLFASLFGAQKRLYQTPQALSSKIRRFRAPIPLPFSPVRSKQKPAIQPAQGNHTLTFWLRCVIISAICAPGCSIINPLPFGSGIILKGRGSVKANYAIGCCIIAPPTSNFASNPVRLSQPPVPKRVDSE